MIAAMQTGDYVLTKGVLSLLGNFRIADAAGATVMRFRGKLRIALRFDAVDAQGRVIFRGQGRLIDALNRVRFSRDGQPCGEMKAEWEGGLRRDGPQQGRYVVDGGAGGPLHTQGDCTTAWSLVRQQAEVARVERQGSQWRIRLLDGTHGEFVLTVVMAVVYQTLGDERSLD